MFRMYRNRRSALVAGVALLAVGRVALAGDEIVNLSLVSASPEIQVGETVEVTLFTQAVTPDLLPISGVQTILNWDPTVLELVGKIENVAPEYEWLLSNFDDDSSLDDLNAGLSDPPVGVPANDGDAFYSALSQLATPPMIPTTGLQVTRFLFQALSTSPLTQITMPLTFGQFTETAVFSATVPGLNILGDVSGTSITVVPEPATLTFLLLLSTGFVHSRRGLLRVR